MQHMRNSSPPPPQKKKGGGGEEIQDKTKATMMNEN